MSCRIHTQNVDMSQFTSRPRGGAHRSRGASTQLFTSGSASRLFVAAVVMFIRL